MNDQFVEIDLGGLKERSLENPRFVFGSRSDPRVFLEGCSELEGRRKKRKFGVEFGDFKDVGPVAGLMRATISEAGMGWVAPSQSFVAKGFVNFAGRFSGGIDFLRGDF